VVTWGLLSTARINDAILVGAGLSDRVRVAAVASRDQDRAETYARERGIDRAYGTYEALLADPEIEAVYVPLPNSLHVEWSIRALEAGKHVLCEKAFDRRVERVEEAFDAAERADRFLMEGFMYRHHPQTRRLSELVADGAIGELRLVRAAFSFSLTELSDVRMRPELDGGSITDVGCYCISAIRLLAGEPESVTATQVLGSTGVDVRFAATLAFPSGVLGHFDCAFDLPYRSELEVVGSEGVLRVVDPFTIGALGIGGAGIELRRGDDVELIEAEQANHFQLELENLGDAIRGRGDPLLGREDAVGQARTIEALYRAAEEGVAVDLA
jgi:D-xylose 1-dehydrogenase (NADP+, D-xylono-1,5-lactone-forming)